MKLSPWLVSISMLSVLPMTSANAQTDSDHTVVGAISPSRIISQASAPDNSAQESWFSRTELDQMLAPIALYPDSVLTHVLIAATYPLEVVEADRWRRANPQLDAEQALQAADTQNWDPSVKALVAFPDLLNRMSEDLRWTQDLGDAFLIAEADVMDRIQALRHAAWDAGSLAKTEEVRIVREQRTIIIEPAVERIVYLPSYDTRVVYGTTYWGSYAPIYWQPFYPTVVHHYTPIVYWGPPVRVTPVFYFSAFHWSRRHVVVLNTRSYSPRPTVVYNNVTIVNHQQAQRWEHKPEHRRGVSYHREYHSRQTTRITQVNNVTNIQNSSNQGSDNRRYDSNRRDGRPSNRQEARIVAETSRRETSGRESPRRETSVRNDRNGFSSDSSTPSNSWQRGIAPYQSLPSGTTSRQSTPQVSTRQSQPGSQRLSTQESGTRERQRDTAPRNGSQAWPQTSTQQSGIREQQRDQATSRRPDSTQRTAPRQSTRETQTRIAPQQRTEQRQPSRETAPLVAPPRVNQPGTQRTEQRTRTNTRETRRNDEQATSRAWQAPAERQSRRGGSDAERRQRP